MSFTAYNILLSLIAFFTARLVLARDRVQPSLPTTVTLAAHARRGLIMQPHTIIIPSPMTQAQYCRRKVYLAVKGNKSDPVLCVS